MRTRGCEREPEMVEALLGDGMATSIPSDLQQHVQGCVVCRELQEVITMLHADARRQADDPLPAAGQVWWRAAVRARMEAAQAAARPVAWVQGMTTAVLMGIVCAAAVLAWPSVSQLFGVVAGVAAERVGASTTDMWPSMLGVIERALPLIVAVATVVVVTPLVVLYVALSGDD